MIKTSIEEGLDSLIEIYTIEIEDDTDVLHFALMYEIKFGTGCYQDDDIRWNYNKLKTDFWLNMFQRVYMRRA